MGKVASRVARLEGIRRQAQPEAPTNVLDAILADQRDQESREAFIQLVQTVHAGQERVMAAEAAGLPAPVLDAHEAACCRRLDELCAVKSAEMARGPQRGGRVDGVSH